MNAINKAILAAIAAMICVCSVAVVSMDQEADAIEFNEERDSSGGERGTPGNPIVIAGTQSWTAEELYEYLVPYGSQVWIEIFPDVTVFIRNNTTDYYLEFLDPGSLTVESSDAGAESIRGTSQPLDEFIIIVGYAAGSSVTAYFSVLPLSVDFTSPDAVQAISGSTITYTAATNISATFAETGGSAASWLNIDPSSGQVSGMVPTVSAKTSYTYTIEATSTGDSTNKTQQTITIDVWPVAQITATNREMGVVQNDPLTAINLSGNVPMTFAVTSGALPAGVTLSGSTISGTPTEYGDYSATIRGTTTEGPEQHSTIVINISVDEDEPVLSITVATPAGPYKAGTSLSFALTSNVSGTTFDVSGTAADWMSVSGSNVVGSVPSTYDERTEVTLTVSARTPQGQTATQSITFEVEPVIQFTTVPTADCVIIPVYSYNPDGTIVTASNGLRLFDVAYADISMSFDVLTISGTFTGQNAETVIWDWGDGTTDTGNKVEHTYSEPGTYTIVLTAANSVGTDMMEITITVGEVGGNDLLFLAIIAVLMIIVAWMAVRVSRNGRGRRD